MHYTVEISVFVWLFLNTAATPAFAFGAGKAAESTGAAAAASQPAFAFGAKPGGHPSLQQDTHPPRAYM